MSCLLYTYYLESLIGAFHKKGEEFAHIIKMGRTQLEDAVPMTLVQTFNGFASILRDEIRHLNEAAADFLTVNMGATAIGTNSSRYSLTPCMYCLPRKSFLPALSPAMAFTFSASCLLYTSRLPIRSTMLFLSTVNRVSNLSRE